MSDATATHEARGEQSAVLRSAAFVAFFLSGASSLVFQTLWSRLLQHVFGSSSVAISSVVSVFMGGLGLGAYYFGKRGDRLRDPLLLYACAEIGVGCAGLIIPLLLGSDGPLAQVNALLRNTFGASSPMFIAARFLCIAPLLIVPTFLMGSTLPLLARHFVQTHSSAQAASREVGRLYAINTLGAVVGVFASSFVLLPKLGVNAANVCATCTNFTLAALVLVLRRTHKPARAAAAEAAKGEAAATPDSTGASDALPRSLRRAAAVAFACSGFASLLYEVVWSRALIDTIGGSLYSFALILATFLTGIGFGSALASSIGQARAALQRSAPLAAGTLTVIAAGPLLPQLGLMAFTVVAFLGTALIAVFTALSRARAARDSLFTEAAPDLVLRAERRFALLMFATPVATALVVCVHEPDRLTRSTLAVVSAIAALLALLLALRERPMSLL
ncbi:MAG TPA: fused MFS/spermidine synthase, partial [Polyangiales bacterium]|nr:fused MFS/spermidine synthase [Polyangiales bacterium]